jgi:hypothetical protein
LSNDFENSKRVIGETRQKAGADLTSEYRLGNRGS